MKLSINTQDKTRNLLRMREEYRGRTRTSLVALLSVLATLSIAMASPSIATVWYVDASATGNGTGSSNDPFKSIQVAVDHAALQGDTIRVRPGVYPESVDLLGKSLTLSSTDGPGATQILIPSNYLSRGVVAENITAPGAWLRGFTITGEGEVLPPDAGIGLHIINSTFELEDCRIVDVAMPHVLSRSPGMYGEDSTLVVTNCSFRDNASSIGSFWNGGGLGLKNCTATFQGCIISGNGAVDGGGAWIQGGVVDFVDCDIHDNYSPNGEGAGMHVSGGAQVSLDGCGFWSNRTYEGYPGGAILTADSTLSARDCTFQGNEADRGGAIYSSNSTVNVLRCAFIENVASQDYGYGQGDGGAIYTNSSLIVERCTFFANRALGDIYGEGRGGAIYGDATIRHCSFLANHAALTGGSVFLPAGQVFNSILWGGSPDEVEGTPSITCSDVHGGFPGQGNIDQDPRFWSPGLGDLHLRCDSPCIAAGAGGSDMGAFPFDPAYGDPLGSTTCTSNDNSTGQAALLSAFGSSAVADNDLFFHVTQLPPGKPGYFLMSDTSTYVPDFGGGQGNLCLGAPQIRFNQQVLVSDPGGMACFQPDLGDLPQGTVVLPGEDWYFQFWYRDSNPNLTHNTSSDVRLLFQ